MSMDKNGEVYSYEDTVIPVMTVQSVLVLMLAVVGGVLLAVLVLPVWLSGLSDSLFGSEPKAFWYLSRGSALVAYGILWFSMASGLIVINKMARVWPGGPTAVDLHQFTSLLGMAFALFHALILIGDQFISYSLVQVLLPFGSSSYKPFWVGTGQLAFYVWAIVSFSFYVRKQISAKTWRKLHYLSYGAFLMALFHALGSGTDSSSSWASQYYWWTSGILLFLTIYRVLVNARVFRGNARPAVQPK